MIERMKIVPTTTLLEQVSTITQSYRDNWSYSIKNRAHNLGGSKMVAFHKSTRDQLSFWLWFNADVDTMSDIQKWRYCELLDTEIKELIYAQNRVINLFLSMRDGSDISLQPVMWIKDKGGKSVVASEKYKFNEELRSFIEFRRDPRNPHLDNNFRTVIENYNTVHYFNVFGAVLSEVQRIKKEVVSKLKKEGKLGVFTGLEYIENILKSETVLDTVSNLPDEEIDLDLRYKSKDLEFIVNNLIEKGYVNSEDSNHLLNVLKDPRPKALTFKSRQINWNGTKGTLGAVMRRLYKDGAHYCTKAGYIFAPPKGQILSGNIKEKFFAQVESCFPDHEPKKIFYPKST